MPDLIRYGCDFSEEASALPYLSAGAVSFMPLPHAKWATITCRHSKPPLAGLSRWGQTEGLPSALTCFSRSHSLEAKLPDLLAALTFLNHENLKARVTFIVPHAGDLLQPPT